MNFQREVLDLANKRGLRLADLDKKAYDALAIEVRTLREKIRDGFTRQESRAAVYTGYRKPTSLPVLNLRKTTCRKNDCGSYGVLVDGSEVCHRCTCSGKDLEQKWRDPKQKCPAGFFDEEI